MSVQGAGGEEKGSMEQTVALSDEKQQQQEDVKPDKEDPKLSIKIKSQDGNEVHFRIRPSTLFAKIMRSYCSKVSIDVDSVRFLFDGDRLDPERQHLKLDWKTEMKSMQWLHKLEEEEEE